MSKSYFSIGDEFPLGDPGYVMSRSELVAFSENPWAWRNGRKFQDTKSTEWGSLVDCIYLTPEEFSENYVMQPCDYPSPTSSDPGARKPWHPGSHWCQNWTRKAKASGKTCLSKRFLDGARKALAVLKEDAQAKAFFDSSRKQTVCRWEYTDPETGIVVPLKCMIDMEGIDEPFLADFKTARAGSGHGFSKSAKSLRYDVQGAFYLYGYRECHSDRDNFAFVVQENSFPYPVSSFYLDDLSLAVGREGLVTRWRTYEGYEQMLARYCRCLADDVWPGHTTEIQPLQMY